MEKLSGIFKIIKCLLNYPAASSVFTYMRKAFLTASLKTVVATRTENKPVIIRIVSILAEKCDGGRISHLN